VYYTPDSATVGSVEQNLSLYYTTDSATVAPVEEQSISFLHTRQFHFSSGRTAIYRITAHQTVPL